ncbi:alpha/beta hydrolase family protein [Blastococcus sp. SYSU D01042]
MADPARIHFADPDRDGQLARTLSMAVVHAADLGEAMAAARRIRSADRDAWFASWAQAAEVAETTAAAAAAAGDRVSARHAFLRASEYRRQSWYYLRSDLADPRLREGYRRHVADFAAAAELMEHPAEPMGIPYEGTSLRGWFFAPDASGTARPTVVLPCGYDSTAEYGWADVPPALDRGYNALVVEGPGQGGVLIEQGLTLRPDYESVLTPVLDRLLARPEVDPARVVLIGRSFAGYLAPRAAAVEHRIAALVCDPAQPEMSARLPRGPAARLAAPVVRRQMRRDPRRREFFGARMAAHGLTDVGEYFAELRRFSMLPRAGGITCPTLVVEAEHDFAGGSGQQLVDALTAPAELVRLTADRGADGHCAGLGQQVWAAAVYPWLHRVLENRPVPVRR